MIADALELGALRTESVLLTDEQEQWLAEVTPPKVPPHVTRTIFEYDLANKLADSDWCVLPITNMEAYLGSSALSRMYLKKLIGTVIGRKDGRTDVCIFRTKARTPAVITAT